MDGYWEHQNDNSGSINVFEFPDQLSDSHFSQEALSSMSHVLAVRTNLQTNLVLAVRTRDCIILQDKLPTVSTSNSIKTVSTDKTPHQSSICCRIVLIHHLEGRHNSWQLCLFINHHATSVRPPVATPKSVQWAEVLKSLQGGPWFKFRQTDKLIWVLIIVVFLSTFSLVPHIISRPIFYISSRINNRQSSYNFCTP